MKGYKTSRDYKRLKEFLDKGWRVIIICGGTLAYAVRGVKSYHIFCVLLPLNISKADFEETCRFEDIEFIEPNEEL